MRSLWQCVLSSFTAVTKGGDEILMGDERVGRVMKEGITREKGNDFGLVCHISVIITGRASSENCRLCSNFDMTVGLERCDQMPSLR